MERGHAPGGRPGSVTAALRRAPPTGAGAGTGAGCRLTRALPAGRGRAHPGGTGRGSAGGRVGLTGAVGGVRVSYSASGGEGSAETWYRVRVREHRVVLGGCTVCAASAPHGATGCVHVSSAGSVHCAPPSASTPRPVPACPRRARPGGRSPELPRPSHGCRSLPAGERGLALPEGSGTGGRRRDCDLPEGSAPCTAHPIVASGRWMRNALALLLLLLLVPGARAAPQGGGHRPEDPAAMRLDPDFDPFSLELPTLLLLQNTVQSLAMPEQDVEALTREQVLLYLFVLHDHDRNRHLDGLELLQLLGTVLAQRNGRQPHLDTVALLVDQALERQDVSRDGLLSPPELLLDPPKQLLSPGQDQGTQGPPLLPHPREPEVLGRNMGVNGPGLGSAEKQQERQEALQAETQQAESPDAGLMEAEDTPKIEAPEAEAPEAEAALVRGDPREG